MPMKPRELFKAFVGKATHLNKTSQTIPTPNLVELYRAKGESFTNKGFVYVDTGQCALSNGGSSLWTDGTSNCTAMAVRCRSKAFLTHKIPPHKPYDVRVECGNEGYFIEKMGGVQQIVLATTPNYFENAWIDDDYAANRSSIVALIRALDDLFQGTLDDVAARATIITGFDGREWTQQCVLAVNKSRIGFFMGEPGSAALPKADAWRKRRSSFGGGTAGTIEIEYFEVN